MSTRQPDADGGMGVPEQIIGEAIIAAHPPHNDRETVQAELYMPIDMVLGQNNAFSIKDGKEDQLKALIEKTASLPRNSTSRNNEIYRKAMIWARLIQIEEEKEGKNLTPLKTAEIVESAYDKLFNDYDALRVRVQIKGFLKEFWDHSTEAVEDFLDRKVAEERSRPPHYVSDSDGLDHKGGRWV